MSSACAPCAFSYGTHARQSVDLYHPTANTFATTFPLLIWVHGGGWREGSKADVPASILALRAEGFAVASVGYRLSSETSSGPFIHYPAQSVDVGAAVSWLRTSPNVTSHRLDPSRFIAAGFSAGGHLASMLALHNSGRRRAMQPVLRARQVEGGFGRNLIYYVRTLVL